jgi:hypothetical protein
MPKIKYTSKSFQPVALAVIDQATAICEEYAAQGFSLTLRQLYYQFVARDLVPNNQQSYNRIGSIIKDARLAGEFDWDYIIDRTRNLSKRPSWASPEALIQGAAEQYLTDTWGPQKRRVEVWIEKDAAIGVIEYVCNENNVPFFSCRGYTSASEMWAAAQRIGENLRNGEQTLILHIGDHDPSGIDMTRDIEDRLRLFVTRDWINEFGLPYGNTRGGIRQSMREQMREQGSKISDLGTPWAVKRIALTIEQIEQYAPPPNFAKTTDSRFEAYMEATGLDESWELDALDPTVMEELIQEEIDAFKDHEAFNKAEIEQEKDRAVLVTVKDNWAAIKAIDWAAIKTAQGEVK